MNKSSKLFLSSLLFLGVLTGCSVADGMKTYSYEFDYQDVDGGLEITGIHYNSKNKKLDITIPKTVLGKKVVSIAENAFKGNKAIQNIVLSENLKEIKEAAFADCNNLVSILFHPSANIYIGNRAFSNTGLESLTLSNKLSFGDESFKDCLKLKTVTSKATSYGSNLFAGCEYLESISMSFIGNDIDHLEPVNFLFDNVPASLKSVSISEQELLLENTFDGCDHLENIELPIPQKIHTLPQGIFEDCTALQSITVPFVGKETYYPESNLTENEFALAYLFNKSSNELLPESLKSVTFHATVNATADTLGYGMLNIKKSHFANASHLEKIVMNGGVQSIEAEAFTGCTALENITISSSVSSIGPRAFEGTKIYENTADDAAVVIGRWLVGFKASGNNHEVSITNNNVQYIADEVFKANPYIKSFSSSSLRYIGKDVFRGATNLEKVTIGGSNVTIPESTFEDCTSLKEVTINNAIEIGNRAFANCSSLGTVEEGAADYILNLSRVTKIGNQAFINNGKLARVDLSRVASIGSSSFEGCSSLKFMTLPASLKTVGAHAFKDCGEMKIYCNAESQPEDWDANWNSSNLEVYWRGEWELKDGIPTVKQDS